jgi:hypothetical protein
VSLLFAIGIILLAAAAALLTRALTLSRVRMSSQVRQIEAYGFNAGDGAGKSSLAGSPAGARLRELAARIGRSVGGRDWRAPVTTVKLRAAGLYRISQDEFHGSRVMLTVALPTLILLDYALAGKFSVLTVFLMLIVAAMAWFFPALLVESRAQTCPS